MRFVAVEGDWSDWPDWPDCHEVHRCVTLQPGAPEDPRAVLEGFRRWPTWMWPNEDVVEFCTWLRAWNAQRPPEERVGFHGLDVYSLWDSLRGVINYLAEDEPQHLDSTRDAWSCFEPYREDAQSYAHSLRLVPECCEHDVVGLLRQLCEQRPQPDGADRQRRFVAEQNAAVVAGAEQYYRALVTGGVSSWNVRDCHMADTIDRLVGHYGPGQAVVGEHNTHIGDARATAMSQYGEVNVGQLVRERHGRDRVLAVGFAGHRGTVVAADAWDAPTRILRLPPARPGSVEDVLVSATAGAGRPGLPVLRRAAVLVARAARPSRGRCRVLHRPGAVGQLRAHRARGPLRRAAVVPRDARASAAARAQPAAGGRDVAHRSMTAGIATPTTRRCLGAARRSHVVARRRVCVTSRGA